MIVEFEGKKPQIASGVFVAPNATLIGDVVVEEGTSISAPMYSKLARRYLEQSIGFK